MMASIFKTEKAFGAALLKTKRAKMIADRSRIADVARQRARLDRVGALGKPVRRKQQRYDNYQKLCIHIIDIKNSTHFS